MTTQFTVWILLVATLPTSSATPRMRLWRAIKGLGCVPLRDGAYLLPPGIGHVEALSELAEQTNSEGGQAWVVDVIPKSANDHAAFVALFDRTSDYADLNHRLIGARTLLTNQSSAAIAKTARRLHKELDALQSIDFFPNDASLAVQSSWEDFAETVGNILSPGEPHVETKAIPRLDTASYQGRTWATRRHLWVDRVASAWLIRRFIDKNANFLWLDSPADCPADALGFDFDGAAFTHVGEQVSFEVLMTSFGLENDRGLTRLAALIHGLDVGGPANSEASGFEAILSGARSRLADDDALLMEFTSVLDSLHAYYQREDAK